MARRSTTRADDRTRCSASSGLRRARARGDPGGRGRGARVGQRRVVPRRAARCAALRAAHAELVPARERDHPADRLAQPARRRRPSRRSTIAKLAPADRDATCGARADVSAAERIRDLPPRVGLRRQRARRAATSSTSASTWPRRARNSRSWRHLIAPHGARAGAGRPLPAREARVHGRIDARSPASRSRPST